MLIQKEKRQQDIDDLRQQLHIRNEQRSEFKREISKIKEEFSVEKIKFDDRIHVINLHLTNCKQWLISRGRTTLDESEAVIKIVKIPIFLITLR